MATTPARGTTSTFAIALQTEATVPAQEADFRGYRMNTPINLGLDRTEESDGALDPNGFEVPFLAASIRGNSPEFSMRLTTDVLPFWFHFFRKVTSAPLPGGGGFSHLFEGDANGADVGMTVKVGLPPVESYIRHDVKIETIEIPIGGTTATLVKYVCNLVHGQSYSLAIEDGGNSGTYVNVPNLHGPVRYDKLGDVYVDVTSVAPFKFKAEITTGVPTFPGIEYDFSIDPLTGRGVWANLQGAIQLLGSYDVTGTTVTAVTPGVAKLENYLGTGIERVGMLVQIGAESHVLASVTSNEEFEIASAHTGDTGIAVHMLGQDFGFYGENYDPLEILWQGDNADFANLLVGDSWSFLSVIPDFSPVFTEFDRFTAAHTQVYFREVGEPEWILFTGLAGTVKATWPLEPEEGLGTQYLSGLDRSGKLVVMFDPFEAVHRERNFQFIRWSESHERIECQIRIQSKPLGDGSAREGFELTLPSASIQSAQRPIDVPGRLKTTVVVTGTTNEAGVSPGQFKVFTSENFTPPVFVGV